MTEDPTYLFRDKWLIFRPDPARKAPAPGAQIGVVVAVEDGELWNRAAWERAPVVITDFVYPRDVAHFARRFQLHIHHERSPEVTTINDGWGTQRGDGKVIGLRPLVIRPGTY